jgi:hypothetical protein
VVSVSGLKIKSCTGDMFPFPFLKIMMIKGRKDWRGFYKSTRKEDLVYLANEFLSVVKLSSFCKILEISKSENIGKKGLKKHNKRGR